MKGGNFTEWKNYTHKYFEPIADRLRIHQSPTAEKIPMNLTVRKMSKNLSAAL